MVARLHERAQAAGSAWSLSAFELSSARCDTVYPKLFGRTDITLDVTTASLAHTAQMFGICDGCIIKPGQRSSVNHTSRKLGHHSHIQEFQKDFIYIIYFNTKCINIFEIRD